MHAIVIKNKMAIEKMRGAGQRLAKIMHDITPYTQQVGISTFELDQIIEEMMIKAELKPVCKGYGTYKNATCISLNDVVVHGIPSKEVILKSGDFVKIDVVGAYKSYCADLARYYFVGEVSPVARRLAQVAQSALDKAIAAIAPGKRLSDICLLIQHEVEQAGFGVVRDFAGHGIGKRMHEAPDVPNFWDVDNDESVILREGMTLAIEPMITEKSYEIRIMPDGWTARTIDGGLAGHVEDTVVVTKTGAEILTRMTDRVS